MPLETLNLLFELLVSLVLFALLPWAHGLVRTLHAVEARLAGVEAKLEERQSQQEAIKELTARVTHLEVQLARLEA